MILEAAVVTLEGLPSMRLQYQRNNVKIYWKYCKFGLRQQQI